LQRRVTRTGKGVRWSEGGGEDEIAVDAAEQVRGRVGRERVAEAVGTDLADPLVVLVLVVDQCGQQMRTDDGQLGGGAHPAGGDVTDTGVDAFGDGVAEGGEPLDRR
jgi:hypothetical protein